jgi:hypothetical protein
MVGPRLILIFAVALTVVYWSLWQYLRAGDRERLSEEWRRDRPPLPEHTYVEIGLKDAAPRLHRRLVLGVYVVPLTVVGAAVLILNEA